MNRRLTMPICALALVLASCHAEFGPPEMTVAADGLEEVVFWPFAQANIPDADLTAIGEGSGNFGDLVSQPTVYAVAGIDPSQYVVMLIDPDRYDEYLRKAIEVEPEWTPPSTAPSHMLYQSSAIGFAPDTVPSAVCAYFDPRSDQTPPECQGPITVTFGGRTYVAVSDSESDKFIRFDGFHVSDLEAIGTVGDIDPRLSFGPKLSDTAYAIDGVDPKIALVMIADPGLEAYHFVFVAEGSELPRDVCRFAVAEVARRIGCTIPQQTNQDAVDQMAANEELWFSNEVVEYTFDVIVTCDCPAGGVGTFTIRVIQSDHVDSVMLGGSEIGMYDEPASWVPKRMTEAFAVVMAYADSDVLEVDYDPDLGYPRRIFADPSTTVDGDEYGFEITELRIE